MLTTFHNHIRSNVIGYFALFVALSGVAYAASLAPNSVRSQHIKNGQVKNADLAEDAVSADKVGADALTGAQIDESSLSPVPSARSAEQAGFAERAGAADSAATANNAEQLGGQAPSAFQQRVSAGCSGAQSIQSIAPDGSVSCGSPAGSGTVTSVGSGTGLTGGPITGSGTFSLLSSFRLPQSCTNGQVAKSNGAGVWNCAADTDTNTTYTAAANSGLALSGTAFGLTNCPSGQVLKSTGTSTWGCAADNAGGSPTGAASGDLTGTYPAPTIAANAVNSAKVSDNTLTGSDINESMLGKVPSAGDADTVGGKSADELAPGRIHVIGGIGETTLLPGLSYNVGCEPGTAYYWVFFNTADSPATFNGMSISEGIDGGSIYTPPTFVMQNGPQIFGASTAHGGSLQVDEITGGAHIEARIVIDAGPRTYSIDLHGYTRASDRYCETFGTATMAK